MRSVKAQEFVIVVYSGTDQLAASAAAAIRSGYGGPFVTFALLDCQSGGAANVDPEVEIVGEESPSRLFGWIAANISQLESLTIASIATPMAASEAVDALRSSSTHIQHLLKNFAIHSRVRDVRIFAPGHGSVAPQSGYFVQGATNLLILPRDAATPSTARPLTLEDATGFRDHLIVELASVLGLWPEMGGGVLEQCDCPSTGTPDEILVRFVSSGARVMNCPPLPIGNLIEEGGELPAPEGFVALQLDDFGVMNIADAIYPQELRWTHEPRPSGKDSVSGRKFRSQYLLEVLRTTLGAPRLLLRNLQDWFDELAGRALWEAVGGASSAVKILFPEDAADTGGYSQVPLPIDEIIKIAGKRRTDPVVHAIKPETWLNMCEAVLGVIDGGEAGAAGRNKIGDRRFVLTSQRLIAGEECDLPSYLNSHLDATRDRNPVSAGLVDGADAAVQEVKLQETADGAMRADMEEGTNPSEYPMPAADVASKATTTEVGQPTDRPVAGDLLAALGHRLADQRDRARQTAEKMCDELRSLATQFPGRDVAQVSRATKLGAAAGLSVVYLSRGSLSEWRNWLSFEALSPLGRDRAWLIFSTVVLGVAVVGLLLRPTKALQARAIVAGSVWLALIGAELVLFGSVRDWATRIGFVGRSPLPALLVMIGTLALTTFSYVVNQRAESKLRRLYAGLIFVVAWIYVIVGVTAYLGSSRSPLRDLATDVRFGWMVVGHIFGAALFLLSCIAIAIVVVRNKYRLNDLAITFQWASDVLDESADAIRRLNAARSQWTLTAASLARLVWYPLGVSFAEQSRQSRDASSALGVLKYSSASISLNPQGQRVVAARLRHDFVTPSWLLAQYQRLLGAYRDEVARDKGLSEEESRHIRPESCPVIHDDATLRSGMGRGHRLAFSRKVFDGAYDDKLTDVAQDIPLERMYRVVLADSSLHSLSTGDVSAAEALGRLIPQNKVLLPGGVTTKAFTADNPEQVMKVHVWWPDEVFSWPATEHVTMRPSIVLAPDRLTQPVRIRAACIAVSEPIFLHHIDVVGSSSVESDELSTHVEAGQDNKTEPFSL
jgi:hypothetical protein